MKAHQQENPDNPRAVHTRPRARFWLRLGAAAASLVLAACQTVAQPPPPAEAAEGKRVEIDQTTQTLRAYEGTQLILESRVSTGRSGHGTPNGTFRVGDKYLMHYSKLYHHAPMPYSVQVNGNIFIHGFQEVPDHPASHGCIRLPLAGDNPAKRFYEWVEAGTLVRISGRWPG